MKGSHLRAVYVHLQSCRDVDISGKTCPHSSRALNGGHNQLECDDSNLVKANLTGFLKIAYLFAKQFIQEVFLRLCTNSKAFRN